MPTVEEGRIRSPLGFPSSSDELRRASTPPRFAVASDGDKLDRIVRHWPRDGHRLRRGLEEVALEAFERRARLHVPPRKARE